MGGPHPLMRRKGPLNLRGKIKMTFRMQEEWTSITYFFFNFLGKYTPGYPLDADASGTRNHPI